MEAHGTGVRPQLLARLGGLLYLIIIVIGVSGEMLVRNRIIVPGDAAATAANLRSMESLWRFGIAGEFVLLICGVALTLILYILLRPVGRELALLAVFFYLVTIAVEAVAAVSMAGALVPLTDAAYPGAFEPGQLHALSVLSVRSHSDGFGAALIFFGCVCLILGWLIFRSGYLPKWIGVLIFVAGLSYLINSFALVLSPAFASRLFPPILIPAFVGETSLCLWLLLKGVDVEKWTASSRASA